MVTNIHVITYSPLFVLNLDCWGFFRDFCFHFYQYSDGILCSATQLENLVLVDRFATKFCFLNFKSTKMQHLTHRLYSCSVQFCYLSNLFSKGIKSKGILSEEVNNSWLAIIILFETSVIPYIVQKQYFKGKSIAKKT